MSPHTFILICIIQSWNSVSCTFNIWLLIIKMSKEWVYIIVKMKMFAQKSTSLNYKKNNWHINAGEIASTMPLRYSIFFSFIIPFIHLNFLPNSSSLNVKILYDGCDNGRSIHWIRFFMLNFKQQHFFLNTIETTK